MNKFLKGIKEFLTGLDEYDYKNVASFLAITCGILVILTFIRDTIQ
jgi:hypothetical protein